MTNYDKLKKYCTIEKNKLICNEPLYIVLDNDKYNADESNIDIADNNEDNKEEHFTGVVNIPCVFQIVVPEKNDTIDVYLPFNVNLLTNNVQSDKDSDTYYFEPGEIILHVSTKSNATNIKVVDMLFENRMKHLTDNIGNRVLAIHSQLLNTKNIQLHHIETILSNTYVASTSEGDIPSRLSPLQKYDKTTARGTKDAVHMLGNSYQSFVYGYSNEAVNTQIVSKNQNIQSDLTKVITGKFDELNTKRSQIKNLMQPQQDVS